MITLKSSKNYRGSERGLSPYFSHKVFLWDIVCVILTQPPIPSLPPTCHARKKVLFNKHKEQKKKLISRASPSTITFFVVDGRGRL